MHLDRAVDHLVQHAGRVELEQRHLDARLGALVDLARGVHRQEPARLDLGGRVGDPVLHRLLVGERAAERLALERVGAHQVERALHLPEPAHHVVDPPRAEPLLREPERLAALAERVRDAEPARLCSAPRNACSRPGRRGPSPAIGRDDRRRPGVSVGTRIIVPRRYVSASGSVIAKTIPNVDAVGAAREPLVPVDHPLVAVERRPACGAGSDRSRPRPARSSRRTTAPARRRAARGTAPSAPSVPNWCRISALPASGAWQPKTSCAQCERPISSFMQA